MRRSSTGTSCRSPEPSFAGQVGLTAAELVKDFPQQVAAPEGAPNIVIIMTDDVGFAASEVFGGPIPTPAFERVAEAGVRLQPLPHHGAVLADARGAPDRAQSPHRRHRLDHGDGRRLSRLQHAGARGGSRASARS